MRVDRSLRLLVAAVALLSAICVRAESDSLEAIIPWDGAGKVWMVAPEKLLFMGAFEGIIYVKTSNNKLDEGFVKCPAQQTLNTSNQKTTGSGHCMITVSGGETVYARWECSGQVGGCEGTFTLVEGTGRFAGITGTGPLLVRTPLRALAVDVASGSTLNIRSGIAVLPRLEYSIPSQ